MRERHVEDKIGTKKDIRIPRDGSIRAVSFPAPKRGFGLPLASAVAITDRRDFAPASTPEPICSFDILHGNTDIPEQIAIQLRQFALRARLIASPEPGQKSPQPTSRDGLIRRVACGRRVAQVQCQRPELHVHEARRLAKNANISSRAAMVG